LHILRAKVFSIISIQSFKNENPSFYAKPVDNGYIPLPSKFEMMIILLGDEREGYSSILFIFVANETIILVPSPL
jgi:hypothetical protein